MPLPFRDFLFLLLCDLIDVNSRFDTGLLTAVCVFTVLECSFERTVLANENLPCCFNLQVDSSPYSWFIFYANVCSEVGDKPFAKAECLQTFTMAKKSFV